MAERESADEMKELTKEIDRQKEVLRQLQLVKMYKKKNNLEELQILIDKWRAVCQEVLRTLQDKRPAEPRPDLNELIENWNLDAKLLKYNKDEDEFED